MKWVYTTLVRIVGSRRRAWRSAASEASSRPQKRHAMTSPAKSSGSAACARVAAEQSRHGLLGAAKRFDLEVRVEIVRDAEIGIDLERPPECLVGLAKMLVRSSAPYFARTRWTRPSFAHAGAKSGSSFNADWYISPATCSIEMSWQADWRADRTRRHARWQADRAAGAAGLLTTAESTAIRRWPWPVGPARRRCLSARPESSSTTESCPAVASSSCAFTRICPPARRSVPHSTASTPASAAIFLRSTPSSLA